jgi:hypothetical protein
MDAMAKAGVSVGFHPGWKERSSVDPGPICPYPLPRARIPF